MPATLRSVLHTTLSALRRPASTDADLLAAFASARDEAAFAELVRRHGSLVFGASLRAVGDRGIAEDVFQATFLLLARKADSISWGPTVGPWLYQAVRRIGAKARAGAARRSFSPMPADVPAPATDPAAALARAEIRAALDEALAALPARLRDPLVLCYLEGLTQDEAAAVLRCSPATIKGRVTRGRERLRKLLERRGLSLSAALSGLLVSESFVSASAVAATARAATIFATTGAASPKVLALLCGTSAGVKLAAGLFGLVLACAAVVAGGIGGSPAPKGSAKGVVRAAPAVPADPGDPIPAGAVARLGTWRLCGHQEPTWVGFSPDGKRVASKEASGIIVWDAATGRRLVGRHYYKALNTPGWRADGTGVAVVRLPDGSQFVSAFADPDEKLPNPKPVAPANVAKPGPDSLEPFALSHDGTRLAVVRTPTGKQFTIDILLAAPGRAVSALKRERTLGPFDGPFQEIRYTSNGSLLFLSARGKVKGEWSLSLVDPVKNVVARTTSIPEPGESAFRYMLSLSADGRLAAIPPRGKHSLNDHEDTIRVWDLMAEKELRSFPFPKRSGYGMGHAFTPDSKRLITSTDKVYFRVWDLENGKETAHSAESGGSFDARTAMAVAFTPDGKRFTTARRDGRVDVWHTATGKAVVPLDTHRDRIDAVAVSPDGRLGATLGRDGTVRVWELATGKPGCVIPAPLETDGPSRFWGKRGLLFTPDGRGLLFPDAGKLAMASPTTGKRLELPRGLRDRAARLGGFAADGKTLMTFAADKVELWDWPAGTVRVAFTVPIPDKVPGVNGKANSVVVGSATLSPDGRFVFTNSIGYPRDPEKGGEQSTNDLWDARTGKRLHQLTKPLPWYPPAAFSLDGRVVYLGGHSLDLDDKSRSVTDALTMWDTGTGKLLRRFDYAEPAGPDAIGFDIGRRVDPLVMSPDGRLLAACTDDRTGDSSVWVYEVASRRAVKKLSGHSDSVKALAFSPDGRKLLSVSRDQTGLVWDVSIAGLAGKLPEMPLTDAWAKLAELDPVPAYAAMAVLAAEPAKAIPLLRRRLRPAPTPTDADVDKLIARMDAESFAEREKASADLEQLGPNAVPRVEARLAKGLSAEARGRLDRHLAPYAGSKPSPHLLRCVRGVAVAEAIGTPAAQALLAEWAKGPKDDALAREAAAAMQRR